ncbi:MULTISPECIES: M48 family metalloprotease [unclassified Pseudodesulfovibrio]|uniref:M48 family metalloprotease n=1 Tax=unclassified Pseudodesulfovibrio TaxID=2661612 RepID=UPI000FEB796E|nr:MULTISPECIES: M48 family metalloprotease [unclassified Pseudodesulfovibrio]MCJ2163461.1 M48 family metalloprotease [Pseudodesulfovibrio sp. S3-i]RWU06698.1 peptidase M48 [Pseudodesulfovibrio sp. S3]
MNRRHFLTSLGLAVPALLSPLPVWAFGSFLEDLGDVVPDEVTTIFQSGKKIAAGFEDITPEQEHYIGRSVAAVILSKYRYAKDRNSQKYLNIMGQTLAQASDRPETFGGYHFLVLDTEEINALSAPGGFIFVTRGLIHCCKSEDAMAAVLAHEIGHVQRKHGLQAIQKSRVTDGVTTLALVGTSTMSGGKLKELTQTFDSSIKDITSTMIESGYSRSCEDEADADAVTIMQRMGYDPNAIIDMLTEMKTRLKPDSKGFGRTHPSPDDRITNILEIIGRYEKPVPAKPRDDRFKSMTKEL